MHDPEKTGVRLAGRRIALRGDLFPRVDDLLANIVGGSTKMRNVVLAAVAGVVGLSSSAAMAASGTVAFLMPDQASTRYEQHDFPGFKTAMAKLCPHCHVVYQNANADASLQQQQFNSVIAQGAKVVVLDPVDSSAAASLVQIAHSSGVKVIAYDRPIPKAAADFYVSFDNKGIGRMIAQSLVADLKAHNVPTGQGGVLEVNGSPTDAAAGLIRDGIHQGLAGSGYATLAEYDTPDWAPPKAQEWTSGQITRFGNKIVGVVAANDGTAGGVIAAFKAAGVNPVPPVTGNDETIAGLQLIIAGDEYNTISKPSEIVAAAAAKVAVALLNGTKPVASTTLFDTPTELFTPSIVTAKNIKSVIFDHHLQTTAQVCTGEYAAPCQKLGL